MKQCDRTKRRLPPETSTCADGGAEGQGHSCSLCVEKENKSNIQAYGGEVYLITRYLRSKKYTNIIKISSIQIDLEYDRRNRDFLNVHNPVQIVMHFSVMSLRLPWSPLALCPYREILTTEVEASSGLDLQYQFTGQPV